MYQETLCELPLCNYIICYYITPIITMLFAIYSHYFDTYIALGGK